MEKISTSIGQKKPKPLTDQVSIISIKGSTDRIALSNYISMFQNTNHGTKDVSKLMEKTLFYLVHRY